MFHFPPLRKKFVFFILLKQDPSFKSPWTKTNGKQTWGAFHSTKNSEISGLKLNGMVKIPGKVFENLGIRFECTLLDGISGIIENFEFHSQEMSGLVSLPSVSSSGHLKKWWP